MVALHFNVCLLKSVLYHSLPDYEIVQNKMINLGYK